MAENETALQLRRTALHCGFDLIYNLHSEIKRKIGFFIKEK